MEETRQAAAVSPSRRADCWSAVYISIRSTAVCPEPAAHMPPSGAQGVQISTLTVLNLYCCVNLSQLLLTGEFDLVGQIHTLS
jgi:hypothetical protein